MTSHWQNVTPTNWLLANRQTHIGKASRLQIDYRQIPRRYLHFGTVGNIRSTVGNMACYPRYLKLLPTVRSPRYQNLGTVGYIHNYRGLHNSSAVGDISSTVGNTSSTVGDILSTVGDT